MRIAFLPVENRIQLHSLTRLSYYFSYLETFYPDTVIYPMPDLEILFQSKPNAVVLYQTDSAVFNKVIAISKEIKDKLGIPIILVGNHITYMSKLLPETVDVGVLGEGEQQLEKLIGLLINNKFDERNFVKIPSVVFHSKGQKVVSFKPTFFQDIDSVNLSRQLFYNLPGNWKLTISTGRGNPHKNIYEENTDFPVRLHSVDFMIKDIVDIVTYFPNIKKVPIIDNVFLHDFTRFKRFCETAKEGRLTNFINLELYVRDYELNAEILHLLKYYLKIYRLNIILTPFKESTQKENKLPNIKKEKIEEIISLCYKLCINTKLYNNLFYSSENKEDLAKRYWFIHSINQRYNYKFDIKNNLIIPKVGTESWSKAISKKLFSEKTLDFNYLNENNISNNTILLSNTNKDENKEIYDKFNYLEEKFFAKEPVINYIKEKIDETKNYYNELEEKILEYIDKRDKHEFQNKEDLLNEITKDITFEPSAQIIKSLNSLDGGELIPENCKMTKERIKERFDVAKDIFNEQDFQSTEEFMFDSIFEKLDFDINNERELPPSLLKDFINNLKTTYYDKNRNMQIDNVLADKSFLSISTINIVEKILKTSDIKSILEVTDNNITDLNKLFSDYYQIDVINNSFFDDVVLEAPSKNAPYDCIVLFFTLDTVHKINRVMNFCNRFLKEQGLLIVNFINSKNIFMVNRLLCNFDMNNMLLDYKKNNYFTIKTMSELLDKYNFIPQDLLNFEFPEYNKLSQNNKFIIDILHKRFKNPREDYTIFSYTYSCRKKARNKINK
ncbi:MAG: hypothetical protein U0457_16415 [Candidatus Sericytochromatia bacterium]